MLRVNLRIGSALRAGSGEGSRALGPGSGVFRVHHARAQPSGNCYPAVELLQCRLARNCQPDDQNCGKFPIDDLGRTGTGQLPIRALVGSLQAIQSNARLYEILSHGSAPSSIACILRPFVQLVPQLPFKSGRIP